MLLRFCMCEVAERLSAGCKKKKEEARETESGGDVCGCPRIQQMKTQKKGDEKGIKGVVRLLLKSVECGKQSEKS